jgi:hypothetical protein
LGNGACKFEKKTWRIIVNVAFRRGYVYRRHWQEASKPHESFITVLLFSCGVQSEHGPKSLENRKAVVTVPIPPPDNAINNVWHFTELNFRTRSQRLQEMPERLMATFTSTCHVLSGVYTPFPALPHAWPKNL